MACLALVLWLIPKCVFLLFHNVPCIGQRKKQREGKRDGREGMNRTGGGQKYELRREGMKLYYQLLCRQTACNDATALTL